MMRNVELEFSTRMINNGPLVIVGTKGTEWDDFASVAWSMPIAKKPPSIALCISPAHKTWENVSDSGELTCNIPGADLIKEAAFLGGISGRDCDKITTAKLGISSAQRVNAPVLSKCLAFLECRVISMDESTHIIRCEVIAASANEDAFVEHWKLENGLYPLHHLGGEFFECGGKKYIQPRLSKWQ